MPPIRLDDLRDGAAGLAPQTGADLKVIQEELGHASIALTTDTYMTVERDPAHHETDATAQLGRVQPTIA